MKKFAPDQAVRLSGYAIILLLVVLPFMTGLWGADAVVPEV